MAGPERERSDLLSGVRIVDWSQFYAGPGGTALLGDMGADVILLERPSVGDPTRKLTHIGVADFTLPNGNSLLFEAVGRNKKSVTVDLGTPKGQEVVRRLVARSDVFYTNFRRPSLERASMTYEALKEVNASLIFSRVSGFGPKGAMQDQGAFDFMVQGFAGMMTAMGPDEVEMSPPLTLVIDQACSMMAAYAVIAALYHRERTGRGQEIHTSLLGTTVSLHYFHYLSAFFTGHAVRKHGRLDPGNALRNYYRCADGKWVICAHNPPGKYAERFFRCIGLDEDWRPYAKANGQSFGGPGLIEKLDACFATKPRDEWLRLAKEHDIFLAPVNTVDEAVDEPQIRENYVEDVDHPFFGPLNYPGFCTHFDENEVHLRQPAPKLGADTEEVLGEVAGYTTAELRQFRDEGVI